MAAVALDASSAKNLGWETLESPAGGYARFITSDATAQQLHGMTLHACDGLDRLPREAQLLVEAAMHKNQFLPAASPRLHLNRWQRVVCAQVMETADCGPQAGAELELTFGTEPLVGWRAWKVVNFHRRDGSTEKRLVSLTGREHWPPRHRATAACVPDVHGYGEASSNVHEAPWPTCQCGIWAVRDQRAVETFLRGEGRTARADGYGPVYLWGRVLEFRKGYRAQYAYPQSVTLFDATDEQVRAIADLYGVPVASEQRTPSPPPEPDTFGTFSFSISLNSYGKAIEAALAGYMVPMAEAAEKLRQLGALVAEADAEQAAKKRAGPRPQPTLKDAIRSSGPAVKGLP